jgi:hypothetical protein
MVTSSTTTFGSSTFCPHSAFVCFVWISEQTAIVSLYNINWSVVKTETKCLLRGMDWTFTNNSGSVNRTCSIVHGPRMKPRATLCPLQTIPTYTYVSMPCMAQAVAGLSPQTVHAGFVVEKVALGQAFYEYYSFPYHYNSTNNAPHSRFIQLPSDAIQSDSTVT